MKFAAITGLALGLVTHAAAFAVSWRCCIKGSGFQGKLGACRGPYRSNGQTRERVLGMLRRQAAIQMVGESAFCSMILGAAAFPANQERS